MKATRALTSSSALYTSLFASVAFGFAGLTPQEALALPQNPVVVSGGASVTQSGSTETITQTTAQAIINWKSFNIQPTESTVFDQPSASAVALNRITGSMNPSQILGNLSANGRIIIVNPNGVFFGAHSTVNVAGLLATTADISNANFNAGKLIFNKPGNPTASIINKGTITAAKGGLVALVAPGVQNDGVIVAKLGTVTLGSAQTFTVDLYGDNLYSFTLGTPTSATPLDQNGNPLTNAVSNTGTIKAHGGIVYMTARAAAGVVTDAINNTGIVEATSARKGKNGTIILDGNGGDISIAGTLDASGKKAGRTGGTITVTGNNITLANATVNASGKADGGDVTFNASGGIRMGGARSGSTIMGGNVMLTTPGDVTLTQDSTITADNNLFINNSGVFSTDTPDVLLGNVVTLNQNLPQGTTTENTSGANSNLIANAIDAINPASGRSQVTLGDGTWTEQVIIDGLDNFTLAGQGQGNTIIAPVALTSESGVVLGDTAPIIYIDGTTNDNITGLTVDGAQEVKVDGNPLSDFTGTLMGIYYDGASGTVNHTTLKGINGTDIAINGNVNVINSTIIDPSSTGIDIESSSGNIVSGNTISNVDTGILVNNSSFVTVSDNTITRVNTGITASNDFGSTISGNHIDFTTADGIDVTHSNGMGVTGNFIGLGGTDSIGGIGIFADPSNVHIDGNQIDNAMIGIEVNGLTGNSTVDNNKLDGIFGDAIYASGDSGLTIAGNLIGTHFNGGNGFVGGAGIRVDANHGNEDDVKILSNTIDRSGGGISVSNLTNIGGHGNLVAGNTLSAIVGDGIDAFRSAALTIAGNLIQATGLGGIGTFGTGTGTTGIYSEGNNGVLIAGNVISGTNGGVGTRGDGIHVFESDNADIIGNFITTQDLHSVGSIGNGIVVDDSQHAIVGLNGILASNLATGVLENGILVEGGSNRATLTGNTILGTDGGSGAGANYGAGSNTGNGIEVADSQDATITFNSFSGTNVGGGTKNNGIYVTDGAGADIERNSILATGNGSLGTGGNGIDVENSDGSTVSHNSISESGSAVGTEDDGIFLSNSGNSTISDNTITATNGGYGVGGSILFPVSPLVNVSGDSIGVVNSDGVLISGNSITATHFGVGALNDGISVSGGSSDELASNTISASDHGSVGASNNGIEVQGSTGVSIHNNTFQAQNTATGEGTTGILVNNTDGSDIENNLIEAAAGATSAPTGIAVTNGTGNNTINKNTLTGISSTGILASSDSNLQVTNNSVTDPGTVGIEVDSSNNAVVGDNTVSNFGIGIELDGSNTVTLSSNTLTDNGTGVQLVSSNDTGFFSDTLSGGSIGVKMDGSTTSMFFGDNNNNFSGMSDDYFVLVNGAMFGLVLNATEQTFDGTIGNNFTTSGPGNQLAAAENKTIDLHNSAGVGLVCYTTGFCPPGGPPNTNPGASPFVNQFIPFQEPGLEEPTFSFAGQTILDAPPSFSIYTVNLNLLGSGGNSNAGGGHVMSLEQPWTLSPSAGGNNPGGDAGPFAGLSPSAGGNTSGSFDQPWNLSPSAGGNNPGGANQLASLSPAAGGNGNGGSGCGNSFLGSGFALNYNVAACTRE